MGDWCQEFLCEAVFHRENECFAEDIPIAQQSQYFSWNTWCIFVLSMAYIQLSSTQLLKLMVLIYGIFTLEDWNSVRSFPPAVFLTCFLLLQFTPDWGQGCLHTVISFPTSSSISVKISSVHAPTSVHAQILPKQFTPKWKCGFHIGTERKLLWGGKAHYTGVFL